MESGMDPSSIERMLPEQMALENDELTLVGDAEIFARGR